MSCDLREGERCPTFSSEAVLGHCQGLDNGVEGLSLSFTTLIPKCMLSQKRSTIELFIRIVYYVRVGEN